MTAKQKVYRSAQPCKRARSVLIVEASGTRAGTTTKVTGSDDKALRGSSGPGAQPPGLTPTATRGRHTLLRRWRVGHHRPGLYISAKTVVTLLVQVHNFSKARVICSLRLLTCTTVECRGCSRGRARAWNSSVATFLGNATGSVSQFRGRTVPAAKSSIASEHLVWNANLRPPPSLEHC